MEEPLGYRNPRRQKRPPGCRLGCLGCQIYKKTAAAVHPEESASPSCSYSDDDEKHPSKKERSLADIYTNGSLLISRFISVDSLVKCEAEYEPDGVEKTPYDDMVCKVCKTGDNDAEMLLCDACDEGFHMYCLCPILIKVPKGKWFCPFCTKKEEIEEFPLVQTKIVDFFHITKPLSNDQESFSLRMDIRRKKRHSLCLYKKKRRLLPHVPSKDPARRLLQMASLATALSSTKVEFSDELTYPRGLAPESANKAANERGGMQVIGKEDLATLNLCKQMCARGEWPPLMVTYDPKEGFVVEADGHIKDMTLIAEYTGDVDYMRNRLNDDSDNLMVLLFPHDASKELVICPDKRGNIARFISGINNHTLEGRKKQNLRCVRYNINGQSRVLLVAIRDIAKGERLYYDYNAYHKEYPTQHFV
ncbi:hypothetical protein KP509_35G025400 [Ceratopteris richardii]|uniref:Uncharacterized protein n=3 Tax=Ceratopteris richardii TaxID=49495 RepID=A0A8T2QEN8_CERRI|nr:hypothetical protein KP509_35G025400 [Ceratopteris richardii]KAH7282329.1 hypothetical protein KP509_35G025400 [Ceratopteris richardii]